MDGSARVTLCFSFTGRLCEGVATVIGLLGARRRNGRVLLGGVVTLQVSSFSSVFRVRSCGRGGSVCLRVGCVGSEVQDCGIAMSSGCELTRRYGLSCGSLSGLLFESVRVLDLAGQTISMLNESCISSGSLMLCLFNELRMERVVGGSMCILGR